MYPHPQPPWGAPGTTAIAVTTHYSKLTFILGLFTPVLAINGQPVPAAWGRTVVPVPPGQHHVHVHVPYLLPPRIGTADTVVPVQPGQVVEVEYRAPAIGWLAGSIGPAPQQTRGRAAAIALVVVSLVVVLLVCCGLGVAVIFGSEGRNNATSVRPDPVPPRTLDPEPGPGFSSPPTGIKPTLRSVPARTLVGPAYAAGDDTYTMGFTGWPFAFRTPGSWGCMAGKLDLSEAKAWVCLDEGDPGNGQRLQIMLRPCPGACGPAERATRNTEWFDPGAKAKVFDEDTSYVETVKDAKGRYTLDMSHYFEADGVTWQVGVGAFTPPATRADIQKTINDVLTQTG